MTKIRDKCTYVSDVRDPVKTSKTRWTVQRERPDGFMLGDENNHSSRLESVGGKQRLEKQSYHSVNVNTELKVKERFTREERKDEAYRR